MPIDPVVVNPRAANVLYIGDWFPDYSQRGVTRFAACGKGRVPLLAFKQCG